jgi:hypothetical protein
MSHSPSRTAVNAHDFTGAKPEFSPAQQDAFEVERRHLVETSELSRVQGGERRLIHRERPQ